MNRARPALSEFDAFDLRDRVAGDLRSVASP